MQVGNLRKGRWKNPGSGAALLDNSLVERDVAVRVAFTTPSLPTIAVSIMSPTLISTTSETTPIWGK